MAIAGTLHRCGWWLPIAVASAACSSGTGSAQNHSAPTADAGSGDSGSAAGSDSDASDAAGGDDGRADVSTLPGTDGGAHDASPSTDADAAAAGGLDCVTSPCVLLDEPIVSAASNQYGWGQITTDGQHLAWPLDSMDVGAPTGILYVSTEQVGQTPTTLSNDGYPISPTMSVQQPDRVWWAHAAATSTDTAAVMAGRVGTQGGASEWTLPAGVQPTTAMAVSPSGATLAYGATTDPQDGSAPTAYLGTCAVTPAGLACTPPFVVADNVTVVATDDAYVYWSAASPPSPVWQASLQGANPTTLAVGANVQFLTLGFAGNLFWCTPSGEILVATVPASPSTTVRSLAAVPYTGGIAGFAADAHNVYFVAAGNGDVYYLPLAGTNVPQLLAAPPSALGSVKAFGMAIDGSSVYWAVGSSSRQALLKASLP